MGVGNPAEDGDSRFGGRRKMGPLDGISACQELLHKD